MSKIIKRGKASCEMNMTPMIDITFQLIIFFILSSNVAAQESVEMLVPKPEQSVAKELGEVSRVVVNVLPVNPGDRAKEGDAAYNIDGTVAKVIVGLEQYTMEQLPGVVQSLQASRASNKNIEVVLRADGGVYYDQMQQVLGAVSGAGVETVKLVAYVDE